MAVQRDPKFLKCVYPPSAGPIPCSIEHHAKKAAALETPATNVNVESKTSGSAEEIPIHLTTLRRPSKLDDTRVKGYPMQNCVDLLMSYENGFCLLSWEGRYGGTWICLMPTVDLADFVRDATDFGDCDMIPLTEYFRSTEWLPIIVEGDFKASLTALEARLASLPREALGRNTRWAAQVEYAVKHAQEVMDASNDYGGCDGKFDKLPTHFTN